MSLSDNDLTKTATLARLNLPDNKREKLANDLNNILDLVQKIDAVDTDNVSPMAHSFDSATLLDTDAVKETNNRDKLQGLVAPENKEAGLYLVPQVIE